MTDSVSFEALPLAAPLQRALREKNYTTPSPIQLGAIPPLLEGRDLLGSAQTGTGKTAAFALPLLHRMHERPRRLQSGHFRALVLTPTRELAVQVADSFAAYGKHVRVRTALVHGGVSAGPQIRNLRRGVDILVATPGRLLDLYGQGHFDFGGVEFFVLDEADRMLDMGFLPDIRRIVAELPRDRQSLFFSATFTQEITRLSSSILTDPAEVRIAPQQATAERVDHRVCFLQQGDKMSCLQDLLAKQKEREGQHLTLVFSRTKHGANRLATQLGKSGLRAEAIHGNKTQGARQRALENFRSGRASILVATDVAARGIDVRDITLVVNFDLPDEPEAYVHRIGRTARAGASGVALSFCTGEDMGELRAIERLLKSEIATHEGHAFHCESTASRRASAPASSKGPRRGNNRRPSGPRRGGRGKPAHAGAPAGRGGPHRHKARAR